MRAIMFVLCLLVTPGCGREGRSARFIDPGSGTSIAIALEPAHPYLAEYRRTLVITPVGAAARRYTLSKDSGGYAAIQLHACAGGMLMVSSHMEQLQIDPRSAGVRQGACAGPRHYTGMFDGGGSRPWRFFPASQRPYAPLRMRGG